MTYSSPIVPNPSNTSGYFVIQLICSMRLTLHASSIEVIAESPKRLACSPLTTKIVSNKIFFLNSPRTFNEFLAEPFRDLEGACKVGDPIRR